MTLSFLGSGPPTTPALFRFVKPVAFVVYGPA
jgi:hypothetical protein